MARNNHMSIININIKKAKTDAKRKAKTDIHDVELFLNYNNWDRILYFYQ